MNGRDLKEALLSGEAEALAARVVLDELRAGRLANALELLERSLDTDVLVIDTLGRQLDAAERERAAGTLQVLRDYRERHPRKSEAEFEGDDDLELRRSQQKVREILHGAR